MHRIFLSVLLLLASIYSYANPIIQIGAPLPLTGKLSLEAGKQQRGYDLWAKMVNEEGGIKVNGVNHRVKITYFDYQSDSKNARKAVETLIIKNKVNFLFAPYGSKAAKEASPIAEKYHIPMIAVTASSFQTYSRGHKYIFGIFTPNKTLIDPLVHLIKQTLPQVNSVALIVRKDLFPLSIARELIKAAKKEDIKIIFYQQYAIGAREHSALLQKLKTVNPAWIVALGYTSDLVLLRKEMSKFGVTASLLTMIAAPAYQEFIDATGELAENITSTGWWHPAVQYTGKDIFGTTANFVTLFQKRYGTLPDYVEASSALAGALFQLAIERSNSIKGELVRESLAQIDETTFWGPIRFGKNGQNNVSAPLVFQIQNGKPVVIFPSDIATGALRLGIN